MTMRRWVDWVNIILGVWLVASPWVLAEAAGGRAAAWASWSAGIAVVVLALAAMHRPTVRRDVMGIVIGTWLIASPWVLGFAAESAASTNSVIMGALVTAYACWATRIDCASGGRDEYDAQRTRPA